MSELKFEIDAREREFTFPCSICKNNYSPIADCRKCKVYGMDSMVAYDLEYEINKLVNGAAREAGE